MLAQTLEHEFYQWLRSKPKNKHYFYCNNFGCCFAKFLKETGKSQHPIVGVDRYWLDYQGPCYSIPPTIEYAVKPDPKSKLALLFGLTTYGTALKRFEHQRELAYA